MLPVIANNDNVTDEDRKKRRATRLSAYDKIEKVVNSATTKPVADSIAVSIIQTFTEDLKKNDSSLIENLIDEEKKLFEDLIKSVTSIQGKTLEEVSKKLQDAIKGLEKLSATGEASGNKQLVDFSNDQKEKLYDQLYKAHGIDKDPTLRERIKEKFVGTPTNPDGTTRGWVQGTSVLRQGASNFSQGFKETFFGGVLKTNEDRRAELRARMDYENKQLAAKEISTETLGNILNPTATPDTYTQGGGEETWQPGSANIAPDTTTKSDLQELKAGGRDTDATFSRSSTQADLEDNWKKLLDLLEDIKKCVCECQCSGGSNIDIDPTRRRPGQRQRQRQRGRGTGILGAAAAGAVGLGLAASSLASEFAGAFGKGVNWVKESVGWGKVGSSNQTPGVSRPPVAEPITRPGARPNAPANDVVRPGARPNTPANDVVRPGARPNTPANDNPRIQTPSNDNTVEELQQQRRANEREWRGGGQTGEGDQVKKPETPETRGSAEPREPRVRNTPSAPAKEAPWYRKAWDRIRGIRTPGIEPPSNVTTGPWANSGPAKPWYQRAWTATKGAVRGAAEAVTTRAPGILSSAKNIALRSGRFLLSKSAGAVGMLLESSPTASNDDMREYHRGTPEQKAEYERRYREFQEEQQRKYGTNRSQTSAPVNDNNPVSRAQMSAPARRGTQLPVAVNDNPRPRAEPVSNRPWYSRAWEATKSGAGRAWEATKSGTGRVLGRAKEIGSGAMDRIRNFGQSYRTWGENSRLGRGITRVADSGFGRAVGRVASNPITQGAVKWGGRALGALGVGFDVYNRRKEGQSWGKTAVGVGGSLGGAAAGAAAGAAIGSVVPVVGTAIGGLVGGAIGYWGGGKVADTAYDRVVGTAQPAPRRPVSQAPAAQPQANTRMPPATIASRNGAGEANRNPLAARVQSGQNEDSSIISRSTAAVATARGVAERPIINVPPPTVIQPTPGNDGMPAMVTPHTARPNDSSWLEWQKRRASFAA